MGVAYLVKEKCHTAMLHDDMTLARLMIYQLLIESLNIGGLLEV